MSVEKVNDCVAFPNYPDWAGNINAKRLWKTEVAAGVDGSEDRSTGLTGALRELSFQTLAMTLQERSRLAARTLEALKTGHAVCPFWPRAQYASDNLEPDPISFEHPIRQFSFVINGLIPHELYWYEMGPYDVRLVNSPQLVLRKSGFFRAIDTTAFIYVNRGLGISGTISKKNFDSIAIDGIWPFKPGDCAFFIRQNLQNRRQDIQRDTLINCGGDISGSFSADQFFTGGTAQTATAPIIISGIIGFPAPAQPIYQTARNIAGADPDAAIVYTFGGLLPGIPCKLRLHWAEIIAGFNGLINRRLFDVTIAGETKITRLLFQPAYEAGWLNKAVYRDYRISPDSNGQIIITLKPSACIEAIAASTGNVDLTSTLPISIDSVPWAAGAACLLKNQTDPAENNLYYKLTDGTIALYPGSLADVQVRGTTIKVTGGATQAGTYWICQNQNQVVIGQDAITFIQTTSPYSAGVNAIELYQYSWEVKQLSIGTQTGKLEWDGFLKTVVDKGDQVFPTLFGKLRLDPNQGLTDRVARAKLTFTEPLGSGVQAISGQCLSEICENAGLPVWPGIAGPEPKAPGNCVEPIGISPFESLYFWGLNPDQNPNLFLDLDAIAWHIEILENEIPYQGSPPIPKIKRGQLFWKWTPNISGKRDAINKWLSGSGNLIPASNDKTFSSTTKGGYNLAFHFCP